MSSPDPIPFPVWEERQRQERQRLGLRINGPCLVCDQETQYRGYDHYGMYGRLGNKWLDKHFMRSARASHIAAMEEGEDFDRTLSALFDQFVCKACKTRITSQWPQKKKEREVRQRQEWIEAEKRKANEEERKKEWDFQITWRDPEPGEFERTQGFLRFAVVLPKRKRVSKLIFRWRVCLTEQCRGNSPAHCVGMWADGRLCAHYYGWSLPALVRPEGDPNDWTNRYSYPCCLEESDLYGPGLARWLERTVQPELATLRPDAVWNARGRLAGRGGHRNDWKGTHCVYAFNEGGGDEYPGPCLIQTRLPDGTVYVQMRNFFTVEQVETFAWEKLGVNIALHH